LGQAEAWRDDRQSSAYLAWAAGEHIGVGTDPARQRAVAEAAAEIMGLQKT
jgi:hypothetical protein